ncbi:putative DNA primase/helicase [Lachnospiraceae bacterium PM6-15]|uniref:phage/plasmid primase, P4 family n=1 Tax=Ohessyouella blattaphilus TaxID=2949333 RepID=UPI003E215E44
MKTVNEILQCFNAPKKISSNSYQCKCPTHDDKKASLTITGNSNKILLYCHAGCATKDILESVGLSFKDISEHEEPQWRERLEYGQGKRIEAVYDYKDERGKYLYSKVRFEGKEIRYITIDRANDTYEYSKGRQATLYRLPELIQTVKANYPVYIVEGEKDAETLRNIGLSATTAGGAKNWRKEYAQYFIGAKVVILPDNDKPGISLKDEIARDLRHYAHSVKWVVTSQTDKGDVTDFLTVENHSKEDLLKLIEGVETRYAPWIYHDNKRARVNADTLADSISKSLSYIVVRRPDEDKDDFYIYENGVYNKCNRNKAKAIIKRYLPVGSASDATLNNVYNLLLCREDNICSYRELDAVEKYINVRNGLYNVETKQLEAHTSKIYSTIQLDCEYHPERKTAAAFERYMNDLCSNQLGEVDNEKKAVIQEFFGLLISNLKGYRLKKSLVLWSSLGNTGKTQFLSLVSELLGLDKVANIPLQYMNEDSRFSLGGIVGKRAIIIGDQTASEIKDASVFKQLTGGDAVKVEPKGKQAYYYTFPGAIAIACNNLPSFTDDKGGHIFERLIIMPCEHVIPTDKRDSFILDKMLKEKSAILNWLLEGLERLRGNEYKLTKARACEEAGKAYREKSDSINRFLSEYYEVTGDWQDVISKKDFDDNYLKWCSRNGLNPINKKNITERMCANGCVANKGNLGGEKSGEKNGKSGERRGIMLYRNVKEKDFVPTDFSFNELSL